LPPVDVIEPVDVRIAAAHRAGEVARPPRHLHAVLDDALHQVERALQDVAHEQRDREPAASGLALERVLELLGDAGVEPTLLTAAMMAHGFVYHAVIHGQAPVSAGRPPGAARDPCEGSVPVDGSQAWWGLARRPVVSCSCWRRSSACYSSARSRSASTRRSRRT